MENRFGDERVMIGKMPFVVQHESGDKDIEVITRHVDGWFISRKGKEIDYLDMVNNYYYAATLDEMVDRVDGYIEDIFIELEGCRKKDAMYKYLQGEIKFLSDFRNELLN